jgi:BCD family chlorophyll transporter-like MFS transporter
MLFQGVNIHVLRLAAFALGYGLTGALTGGTLNRIMVAELNLPISLVGLFFAAPLFVAPLRAWLGHRSDAHPIRGLRREPYILLGSALAGIGVVLAIVLLLGLSANAVLLAVGVMLAFVIHEFGRNLSHNSFQALLADRFSGNARARAMTLFEIVTLLGLIIGAGGIAGGLRNYTPERLVVVTIMVAVFTFVLSLLAALRNEARDDAVGQAVDMAKRTPFATILRQTVLGDAQVRLFFILVVMVVMGTLAQDVLLEPYGALVLNMDVAATSRLTMFWGIGVIVAMLASGLLLIQRFGQLAVMRMGIIVSIFAFGGVVTSGISGQAELFRALVFFMGFGTGLAGAGLLTSIIHFTTRVRAGLLLGVWGFAMLLGRSLGSLLGGTIVDVLISFGNATTLVAYATVFTLEAVLLIIALVMTTRIEVSNTKAAAEERSLLSHDAAAGAAALS